MKGELTWEKTSYQNRESSQIERHVVIKQKADGVTRKRETRRKERCSD